MRELLFVSILGSVAVLSGCGPSDIELKAEQARKEAELKADIARKEKEEENAKIETLKGKVKEALKDPESAQFRNLQYLADSNSLCGEVNAKNSMGGYVGFKSFAVSAGGNPVILQKLTFNSVIWDKDTATKAASLYMQLGDSTSANGTIQDIVARDSFSYWDDCVTNPELKKSKAG